MKHTLDVRFHQEITEDDINNWSEYYWTLGEHLNKLIIDDFQAKRLAQYTYRQFKTDRRSKSYKYYQRLLKSTVVYDTDFGRIKLIVKPFKKPDLLKYVININPDKSPLLKLFTKKRVKTLHRWV